MEVLSKPPLVKHNFYSPTLSPQVVADALITTRLKLNIVVFRLKTSTYVVFRAG